jgi:hypothetical protein
VSISVTPEAAAGEAAETSLYTKIVIAIFWRSLSLVVNHQASELLNAPGSFLEFSSATCSGGP